MTIEDEITQYFTLMDAEQLIKQIGFDGFIEELFRDKHNRVLTNEEGEALAVLTKGWTK